MINLINQPVSGPTCNYYYAPLNQLLLFIGEPPHKLGIHVLCVALLGIRGLGVIILYSTRTRPSIPGLIRSSRSPVGTITLPPSL